MPLGLLDLAVITEQLKRRLTDFSTTFRPLLDDPITVGFTGLAPDAARNNPLNDCEVSLFLFHVTADRTHRNTYPTGGPARRVHEQPLALTLYYLVTAYSPSSWDNEQRAMSLVLKCFHETPSLALPGVDHEVTLTLEPHTTDEIGRLWQATASAMRLSTVYRASVVFLEARAPEPPDVVRHAPDFRGSSAVAPFPADPGPIAGTALADRTGLAAIEIAGAGFIAGTTTVNLRALRIFETSNDPEEAGRFRVIDGDRLHVRLPLFTPPGVYLVSVWPAPRKPMFEIQVTVSEPPTIVPVAGGVATVVIFDADFADGTTTGSLAGASLTPTTGSPGPGELQVTGDETVVVAIPTGTAVGLHRLVLVPDAGRPAHTIALSLDVT
jgi:hypothetical protein